MCNLLKMRKFIKINLLHLNKNVIILLIIILTQIHQIIDNKFNYHFNVN